MTKSISTDICGNGNKVEWQGRLSPSFPENFHQLRTEAWASLTTPWEGDFFPVVMDLLHGYSLYLPQGFSGVLGTTRTLKGKFHWSVF